MNNRGSKMRKKRIIEGLNNSQKIRVIVEGVGLYMTVGQVETMFATTNHRAAICVALQTLSIDRIKNNTITGIGTTVKLYDHTMQARSIPVQVDLL
jgi:O-methyltransferase involved in polyketide biosynthesis